MRRFFGKLGFIHRRLWERDSFYRIALLAGPAPLIGGGVAAGIWIGLQAFPAPAAPLPQWGKPPQAAEDWSASGGPQTLPPTKPLPPAGANGELSGYEKGWQGSIHTVTISPTYNTDITQTALSSFFVEGLTGDLTRIVAEGPQNTKFIGSGHGFLVVRTAGLYALSARFERPPGPTADCLTRLYFGPRKAVSNYNVANPGNTSKTFDAIKFDLQPGLYYIGWVLGCWRGQETVGPGRVTVLVSHPGEEELQPVRPEDIVRAERVK